MGRPKNRERRRAPGSDLIPPLPAHNAMKATSPIRRDQYKFHPTLQATSNVSDARPVVVPTALVGSTSFTEHHFLQDFPSDADWAPTTGPQALQLASYVPYRTSATPDPLNSAFQERDSYHQSIGELSDPNFSTTGFYPPRHPSLDLFTRLSVVQMELWKRKNRAKKIPGHQEASSRADIDDFIQTTSDICDIATTAVGRDHSTDTSVTSSHDMQAFYFQLMMSVSAALDILSCLATPVSSGEHGTPDSQGQSKDNTPTPSPNLVRIQSSFFALLSLRDSDHLNKILTLTTLDYYLSRIGAVLSNIDQATRIDGLHQGVEDVIGRSQHFRHLISSSLQELRGG